MIKLPNFSNALRERHQLVRALAIYNSLYQQQNPTAISLAARKQLQLTDPAYTYGEITFAGFAKALAQTNPTATDIFYDFGSGAGKAVFSSALLYPFKQVVGIEYLAPLVILSQQLQQQFLQLCKNNKYYCKRTFDIDFKQGNFLNIDTREASIIFINATCYDHIFWQQVSDKLIQQAIGTRVITTSKQLQNKHYTLMKRLTLPMSWDFATVFIYEKNC